MSASVPHSVSAGSPLALRWLSAGSPLALRWLSAGLPIASTWLIVTFSSVSAYAQVRVAEVEASAFYVHEIELTELVTTTFEVVGSVGSDEIIHLVRMDPNGSNGFDLVRVATNDNATPPIGSPRFYTSRLSYRPPLNGTARYMLIIRAKATGTGGTADLYIDGNLVASSVPSGGTVLPRTIFAFAQFGFVTTVPMPGGSTNAVMIAFPNPTTYGISRFGFEGIIPGVNSIDLTTADHTYLFGTPIIHRAATGILEQHRPGFARVYINDFTDFSTYPGSKDKDGDGVGDLLEQALGTCWDPLNCAPEVVDARDTDRDGLPDGEEVFGVAASGGSSRPWVPARWGADPMHKDLFLIVGWLGTTWSIAGGNLESAEYSPFDSAVPGGISDLEDWITTAYELFNAAPGDHVMNPERPCVNGWTNLTCTPGVPFRPDGIHLHMDFGFSTDDFTWDDVLGLGWAERRFGRFDEGYEHRVARALRLSFESGTDMTLIVELTGANHDGATSVIALTGGSAVANRDLLENRLVNDFGPELIVYATGLDDQNRPWLEIDVSSPDWNLGLDMEILAAPSANTISISNVTDHQNRDHALDNDFFPESFRRRARYALLTGGGGGGQANPIGGRFLVGHDVGSFVHELGHTLGLEHNGHLQWLEPNNPAPYTNSCDTEFNCVASYRSLMNYAAELTPLYFSAVDTPIVVNPTNVTERTTWPGMDWSMFDPAVPTRLAGLYSVLHAGPGTIPGIPSYGPEVDWDYSGSSPITPVRASFRSADMGCRAYSEGIQQLTPDNAAMVRDSTLVEASNRMYAFSVEDAGSGPTPRCTVSDMGAMANHGCAWESNALNYDCRYDPTSEFCTSCVPPATSPPQAADGCFIFSDCSSSLNASLADAMSWDALAVGSKLYLAAIEDPVGSPPARLVVHTFDVDPLNGELNLLVRQELGLAAGRPELAVVYGDPAVTDGGWGSRIGLFVGDASSGSLLAYRLETVGTSFVAWNSAATRIADFDYEDFDTKAPLLPTTIHTDGYLALVGWPGVGFSAQNIAADERATCGYISDLDGGLVPHCFDDVTESWRPMVDELLPQRVVCDATDEVSYLNTVTDTIHCARRHSGPIDLAMRHHRISNGDVDEEAPSGNLILSMRSPSSSGLPELVLHLPSGAGGAAQGTLESGGWAVFVDHMFKNVWFRTANQSMDLHESVRSGGMSAIAAHPAGSLELAHLYPFADGITDTDFGVFSDYRVMREYLCRYTVEKQNPSITTVDCGVVNVRN